MASPISGQVSVSGTAAPLSSTPLTVAAFTIKAPLANSATIYIGPAGVTTGTGYGLDPGDTFEYERSSQNGQVTYQIGPNDVYVVGSGGDKATWLASPGS